MILLGVLGRFSPLFSQGVEPVPGYPSSPGILFVRGGSFVEEFLGDRLSSSWFAAPSTFSIALTLEEGGLLVDTGLVPQGEQSRLLWLVSTVRFSPQSFFLESEFSYLPETTGQTLLSLIFFDINREPARLMMDLISTLPQPQGEGGTLLLVGGELSLNAPPPQPVVLQFLPLTPDLPTRYHLRMEYDLSRTALSVAIPELSFAVTVTGVVFDGPRGIALLFGAADAFSRIGVDPVDLDSRLKVRVEGIRSNLTLEQYLTFLTPFAKEGVPYELGTTTQPAVLWLGNTGLIEITQDGTPIPADGVHDVAVALVTSTFGRHTLFTPLPREGIASLPNVLSVDAYETYFFAQGYGNDYRVNLLPPPDTLILSGPPELTLSPTVTFTFTSNDPLALFECRWDRGLWQPCTSPYTVGVEERTYRFEVRAVAGNGDRDPTPAERVFVVMFPPETILLGTPPAYSNLRSLTFAFAATGTHPPFSFRCSLDGGGDLPCDSPITYTTLSEGAHTFSVVALDSRGLADETPASFSFTLDYTPPRTTILSGPPAVTDDTRATFTFLANEPAQFECSLDGGEWQPCLSPYEVEVQGYGSHTFQVRALDQAGNLEPEPPLYTWELRDLTPPETVLVGFPPSPTASTFVLFQFLASEPAQFFCSLNNGAYAPCTSPQVYTGLSPGSYTFRVYAVDRAGNADPTPALYTFKIIGSPSQGQSLLSLGEPLLLDAVLSPNSEGIQDALRLRLPFRIQRSGTNRSGLMEVKGVFLLRDAQQKPLYTQPFTLPFIPDACADAQGNPVPLEDPSCTTYTHTVTITMEPSPYSLPWGEFTLEGVLELWAKPSPHAPALRVGEARLSPQFVYVWYPGNPDRTYSNTVFSFGSEVSTPRSQGNLGVFFLPLTTPLNPELLEAPVEVQVGFHLVSSDPGRVRFLYPDTLTFSTTITRESRGWGFGILFAPGTNLPTLEHPVTVEVAIEVAAQGKEERVQGMYYLWYEEGAWRVGHPFEYFARLWYPQYLAALRPDGRLEPSFTMGTALETTGEVPPPHPADLEFGAEVSAFGDIGIPRETFVPSTEVVAYEVPPTTTEISLTPELQQKLQALGKRVTDGADPTYTFKGRMMYFDWNTLDYRGIPFAHVLIFDKDSYSSDDLICKTTTDAYGYYECSWYFSCNWRSTTVSCSGIQGVDSNTWNPDYWDDAYNGIDPYVRVYARSWADAPLGSSPERLDFIPSLTVINGELSQLQILPSLQPVHNLFDLITNARILWKWGKELVRCLELPKDQRETCLINLTVYSKLPVYTMGSSVLWDRLNYLSDDWSGTNRLINMSLTALEFSGNEDGFALYSHAIRTMYRNAGNIVRPLGGDALLENYWRTPIIIATLTGGWVPPFGGFLHNTFPFCKLTDFMANAVIKKRYNIDLFGGSFSTCPQKGNFQFIAALNRVITPFDSWMLNAALGDYLRDIAQASLNPRVTAIPEWRVREGDPHFTRFNGTITRLGQPPDTDQEAVVSETINLFIDLYHPLRPTSPIPALHMGLTLFLGGVGTYSWAIIGNFFSGYKYPCYPWVHPGADWLWLFYYHVCLDYIEQQDDWSFLFNQYSSSQRTYIPLAITQYFWDLVDYTLSFSFLVPSGGTENAGMASKDHSPAWAGSFPFFYLRYTPPDILKPLYRFRERIRPGAPIVYDKDLLQYLNELESDCNFYNSVVYPTGVEGHGFPLIPRACSTPPPPSTGGGSGGGCTLVLPVSEASPQAKPLPFLFILLLFTLLLYRTAKERSS